MTTVHDVPHELFLSKLSDQLRKVTQIQPPAWVQFAKMGAHVERQPQDPDWWHLRCASLLRKIYLHGPLGLNDLKSAYGGRRRRHYYPGHHRDAGGSAIRNALHQLEAAGFVTKEQGKGRMITSKGRSALDRLSVEIFKELVESNPILAKYG